jgi:hypothetical protein
VLAAASGLATVAAVVALDAAAAYRLTRGKLRLPIEIASTESICPVNRDDDAALLRDTMRELGAPVETPLPTCSQYLHIPDQVVLDASPYPPFAGELDRDTADLRVASAVVTTRDKRRMQLTLAVGRADTTPSVFVPPARGDETGRADHLLSILFVHEPIAGGHPLLHHVSWASREIGGIEHIREAALTFSMLAGEVALLLLIAAAYRLGRGAGR